MDIQAYLLSQGISVSEQVATRLAKGLSRVAPPQEAPSENSVPSSKQTSQDFLDMLKKLSHA